ncbi:MAG: SH3 domain-containing protein [Deltaproteobacteria bacterium]|nr:SH3 domain-containing protein [Deltaproteobacteria bacterium]
MEEKIPRRWVYLLIFLLFAAGAIVVWRSMRDAGTSSPESPAAQEPIAARESRPLEKERDEEIRGLEREITMLRSELDERAARIRELKANLERTSSALALAERKLGEAQREKERLAALAPQTRTGELSAPREAPGPREASPPKESAAAGIWRRPAEAGTYETVRATSVFQEPSRSARKVATIGPGTKVTVVGSQGEWLEVRSKHGNPPGFIPREDAMLVEKR